MGRADEAAKARDGAKYCEEVLVAATTKPLGDADADVEALLCERRRRQDDNVGPAACCAVVFCTALALTVLLLAVLWKNNWQFFW